MNTGNCGQYTLLLVLTHTTRRTHYSLWTNNGIKLRGVCVNKAIIISNFEKIKGSLSTSSISHLWNMRKSCWWQEHVFHMYKYIYIHGHRHIYMEMLGNSGNGRCRRRQRRWQRCSCVMLKWDALNILFWINFYTGLCCVVLTQFDLFCLFLLLPFILLKCFFCCESKMRQTHGFRRTYLCKFVWKIWFSWTEEWMSQWTTAEPHKKRPSWMCRNNVVRRPKKV